MLTSKGGRPIVESRTMLGSFIRQRRSDLGLSVAEAAEAWGMTTSAIYMIERGDRSKIQPDTLRKIARGLGITVDELLEQASPTPA